MTKLSSSVANGSDGSLADVAHIVASCDCSEVQARVLLKLADGDPDVAITRYRETLSRYGAEPYSSSKTEKPESNHAVEKDDDAAKDHDAKTEDDEKVDLTPDTSDETLTGGGATNGDGASELSPWDFVLPAPQGHDSPLTAGGLFDTDHLVSHIYHEVIDRNVVGNYLASHSRKVVSDKLNETIHGFPSIFYAVATNDEAVVRMWVEHGASVSAAHAASGTPLLAFAIAHGERAGGGDTTAMVATLLSLGASPHVIPSALFTPYDRDLDEDADAQVENSDGPETAWCAVAARKKLICTLNLVQRYYLSRATKLKQPSAKLRSVAKLRKATPLLGVQYFLIGQTIAANALLRKLVRYLTLPARKPPVLVFAGPSGHGKTELARQLGNLMSLPLHVVDCAAFTRPFELFGGRPGYEGAKAGSSLNNFLAKNAGQRCVVFLDEFEKTSKEIHQSLLLPFDNAEYEDRRDNTKVECSRTIWVLATNAFDHTITTFCDAPENAKILSEEESSEKAKLGESLSKALRQAFLSRFGAPLTGRVSEVIPFLPFTKAEQAVIVRKFLLELQRRVRLPIVVSEDDRHSLLGDINLMVKGDSAVSRVLADNEYDPALGSRSLARAVNIVEDKLIAEYLEQDEEVQEGKELVDYVVAERAKEVSVFELSKESPSGDAAL